MVLNFKSNQFFLPEFMKANILYTWKYYFPNTLRIIICIGVELYTSTAILLYLRATKLAQCKNCQNGTFEAVHEIQIFFGQNTSFEAVWKYHIQKNIHILSQGRSTKSKIYVS